MVKVINSPLAKGPNALRECEARRIITAIERAIARKPEFQGTVAVHVDYVSRNPATGESRTIDAIDFRKDQQGPFRHHIT